MKVRTESLWRELLQSWQASGMTIDKFCAANQVSTSSFYKLQRIVGDQSSKPMAVATKPLAEFIAIDLSSKSVEPGSASQRCLLITTSYGARLEIPL